MRNAIKWQSLAMGLAYINVAWNLLLYAVNPARGSLVLAGAWLVVGLLWTGSVVMNRRRRRVTAERHQFLMRPQPRLPDPFRRAGQIFVLEPGERIIHIPQVGGVRRPQVPTLKRCSHWPRDTVKLSDGTTVGYICRRCDHDWVDENYVRNGRP